jgi:hypothetical protein
LNQQLLALSSLPSLVDVDVPTVATDESGEMHISDNCEDINALVVCESEEVKNVFIFTE